MDAIHFSKVLRIDADGLRLDLGKGIVGLVPTQEVFVDSIEAVRLGRTIYQGKLCIVVGDTVPVVPIRGQGRSYSRREAVIQAATHAGTAGVPSIVSVRILEIAFDEITCLAETGYEMVLDRRITEEAISADPQIKRRLSPEKVLERSWLYPGDRLYARPIRLIAAGRVEGELVLHGKPVAGGRSAGAETAKVGPPLAPPSLYEEVLIVNDDPSVYADQLAPYFARGGYGSIYLVSNLPELERWQGDYLTRQQLRAQDEKQHSQQEGGACAPRAAGLLALVRLDADSRAFRWEEVCKALVAGAGGVDVILLCHDHIDFARRLRNRIQDNRDACHVRNVWSLTFGLQGLGAVISGLSVVDRGDTHEELGTDGEGNGVAVPSLYRYRSFGTDCATVLSGLLQFTGDKSKPHTAILFQIHRQSHEVEIECAVGDQTLVDGFRRMTWHLHKSPIRDLAIYGRDADIDDASTEPGRYFYFLRCAGSLDTSLSVMGRRLVSPPGSPHAHVVFVFSQQSSAFSGNTGLPPAMSATCTAIQSSLMARALDRRLQQISETAELAFDFRHMSHEAVALLRESLPLISPPMQAPECARLRENAERAMALLRRVLKAALDNHHEVFSPSQVARSILDRCRIVSGPPREDGSSLHSGIQTAVLLDGLSELQTVEAARTIFECVLRNLVLNSFFQIIQNCSAVGRIEVRLALTCDKDDGQRRLAVSVVDTGPGIHGRYWEDVFVTGVSTREGGTGFGLPLSRRLLTEVHGELALVSSHVYGGSEFRFTLPVEGPADSEKDAVHP